MSASCTSPRNWIAAITFLAAVWTSGCGPIPGGGGTLVWGPAAGSFLRFGETDERFPIERVSSGWYGPPSDAPSNRRIVALTASNGMQVEVSFKSDPGDTSLALTVPSSTTESWPDAVNLIDYRGFEGGPRNLCTADERSPSNAGEGAVEFTELEVNEDNVISHVRGSLLVKLTGCSIPGTQVQARDVTLEGRF